MTFFQELQRHLPLILAVYLAAMNLAGFLLMGWDKRCARKGRRRIPERTLFAAAFLGGSVGALAGMYVIRHKTKHLSFVIGIPLILILQLLLAGWLLGRSFPR